MRCNAADASWYVVPADRKWFRNPAVREVLNNLAEEVRVGGALCGE